MYSTAHSWLPPWCANHAEKMERMRMIRLRGNNLPIDPLGSS